MAYLWMNGIYCSIQCIEGDAKERDKPDMSLLVPEGVELVCMECGVTIIGQLIKEISIDDGS